MFTHKRLTIALGLVILLSMAISACQPETVVETVIVTEVVMEEGEEVIVEKVVTPTPAPLEFKSDDPTTFTWVTFGDIETLDPAWNYESFGDGFLEDIYDTLVDYPGPDATTVKGELAESWTMSEDGLTYVFKIREGVKFHEGQDLTAEDVAYSFQRGLLQGATWSPQWLFTEAFYGAGIYDVAELIDPSGALDDDREGVQAADPELLLAACEQTMDVIQVTGDYEVTMTLAQPWGPLLATMAGSWGSIIDKDWAIEQGAWDGDCATWQDYYWVDETTSPLRNVTNGTGPFKLDHWTPGEEVVMVANEDYWLTEPLWEGGPSGPPSLKRVVTLEVDEWGTRFAMAQAGDADLWTVPRENVAQIDPLVGERCDYVDVGEWDCQPTDNPAGPFRLWIGYPLTSRTDIFFTFEINTEGGNTWIGSGELDGDGIPPDFFSDVHVRRAMNYCFDFDAYIQQALVGEAVQNYGPINKGLLGYQEDADHYYFDMDKCAEELQLAWDGEAWEKGFRFQIGFNTGNVTRQTIASILQADFGDLDPKFQVEIVGLPWPSLLSNIRRSRVPVMVTGWGEDIHDPHNWVQPMMVGTYASRQQLPQYMFDEFGALITEGVTATTNEGREAAYHQLNALDYEYVPGIRGAVPTGRAYTQRWVTGWYYNPMVRIPFYAYGKE
jgi:peptide/nickel transport system substrate-binding protein